MFYSTECPEPLLLSGFFFSRLALSCVQEALTQPRLAPTARKPMFCLFAQQSSKLPPCAMGLRERQRTHADAANRRCPYPCSPAARSEQERPRGAAKLLLKEQRALASLALAMYGQSHKHDSSDTMLPRRGHHTSAHPLCCCWHLQLLLLLLIWRHS